MNERRPPSVPPGFLSPETHRTGTVSTELPWEIGGDDTHGAIRAATYRALCEHGYADTTIQQIADEFEKSKSLLYYHYEDKDELLTDLLDHLLDQFAARLDTRTGDPTADLRALLDCLLPVPMTDEAHQFRRVIVEIRAGASHDEPHRELVARSDDIVRDAVRTVVERGVETGEFAPVDPAETAEFVHAALLGAMVRGATLDDPEAAERTRRAVDSFLQRHLGIGAW